MQHGSRRRRRRHFVFLPSIILQEHTITITQKLTSWSESSLRLENPSTFKFYISS